MLLQQLPQPLPLPSLLLLLPLPRLVQGEMKGRRAEPAGHPPLPPTRNNSATTTTTTTNSYRSCTTTTITTATNNISNTTGCHSSSSSVGLALLCVKRMVGEGLGPSASVGEATMVPAVAVARIGGGRIGLLAAGSPGTRARLVIFVVSTLTLLRVAEGENCPRSSGSAAGGFMRVNTCLWRVGKFWVWHALLQLCQAVLLLCLMLLLLSSLLLPLFF